MQMHKHQRTRHIILLFERTVHYTPLTPRDPHTGAMMDLRLT